MAGTRNEHSKFNNFIAGYWVPPSRERYLTLECKAGITLLPSSCNLDIDRAVRAAQIANYEWLESTMSHRVACLAKLGRLMKAFQEEQRLCASSKHCSSVWACNPDSLTEALQHLLHPLPAFVLSGSSTATTERIAVGKLFLDGAEDIAGAFRQISPALAAGYTLVVALLHRQHQPLCLQLLSFMEYAAHSLPPGILNLVYGLGIETGVPLCNRKDAVPVDVFLQPQIARKPTKQQTLKNGVNRVNYWR